MSISEYAPIVIVCYNDKENLKKLIDSLCKNTEFKNSVVHFYCDGPKNKEDLIKVRLVLDFLDEISSTKPNFHIFQNTENMGLYFNITNAVSNTLKEHPCCIVLEDDLIVSSKFLEFMNFYLNLYKDIDNVGSISGYTQPMMYSNNNYFFKGGDCWGWATWSRSWKHYEHDTNFLYKEISKERFKFSHFYTSRNYGLLKQNLEERNSWAINWHCSLYIRNMLTIAPYRTLVRNQVHMGNRENSGNTRWFDQKISKTFIKSKLPVKPAKFISTRFAISNLAYYFYRIFEKYFLKKL